MLKTDTINLAFICDDNYALCTGVAISSLKENREKNRNYRIYVICDGVDSDNKELFLEISEESFEINLVDVTKEKRYNDYNRMRYAAHVSSAALYKFDLPQMLDNIDKVLYIDGDVIIREGLQNLYDINLDGKYAAVCKDIGAEYYPAQYNSRLKINHSAYFNSGVMLLNLEKLRKDNITQKLINYKINGINHFMDQDAFNVVFSEKVVYIPFEYNTGISCWRDRNADELIRYYEINKKDINQIYSNAKILHLSAPEKPWLYFDAIASEEWIQYLIQSPFRKKELHRVSNPIAKEKMTNGCEYGRICYQKIKIPRSHEIKVSVIIPVYNAEKYINECIESLMTQTLQDVEFIFVDDGSIDDSVNIIQHYMKLDSRISLYLQKNSYAGIARNNGMSHAVGKYITFLDSDDIMLPDALELFYEKAEETHTDIVISSAYHFCNDLDKRQVAGWCLRKEYLPSNKEIFSIKDHSKYIFQISAGAPWGKLYRREFIENNKILFPRVPRAEDFYFVYLAFVMASAITTIENKTILYRIIPGSGSLEDAKDKYPLAQYEVRKLLVDKLKEIGIYEGVEQSFINSFVNGLVYHLQNFKTKEAFTILLNKVKEEIVPNYNIDFNNPAYFYSKNEFNYLKKVYELSDIEQYWVSRIKSKKKASKESRINDETSNYQYLQLYNELNAIKNSWSYRIGRTITWLPRKIYRGYLCCQDHGCWYTLKRLFFVHIIGFIKLCMNKMYRGYLCCQDHGFLYTLHRLITIHLGIKLKSNKKSDKISKIISGGDKKVDKDYLYYSELPTERYEDELKEWYEKVTGEKLDLDNPVTFNEKIQWLKLYDSTPIKSILADKYLVRDWVKNKIGEEYLVPLLGVWDSFEEIDFEKLPEKFALKANHGSGWNVIVKDKSKLNLSLCKEKFDSWLNLNFAFVFGFELHYLNINPKIIAEKYIENIDQLYDYKVLCFDGEPKLIWVDSDRFKGHRRTFYTLKWEKIPVEIKVPNADKEIPKPVNLSKMIEFAKVLSQGFAHARVDFYEVEDQLFFGEITFTSSSGTERATPRSFEVELGNMITLPQKKSIPIRSRNR